MKRMMAFILSFVIIVCHYPLNVSASENTLTEYEKMISLACEVFPEYRTEFIEPSLLTNCNQRGISTCEVIYSETRQYDDSAFLTYTKFSDGLVVLASGDPTDTKTITSYGSGSGGTTYTMTLKLVCPGYNGYFLLENVSFTTASGSYDVIHNCGSAAGSTVYSYSFSGSNMSESTTSDAYVRYSITFYSDLPGMNSYYRYRAITYTFYVGNNSYWSVIQG